MKKHLKKNSILSEEEEKQFQSSSTCCIFEKFVDYGDEKVRDHCHVARKVRDATHWSCNMD